MHVFIQACILGLLTGGVYALMASGLALGFGYWVVLALSNALGQSGVVPAVIAAWAANAIFLLMGGAFFLSSE